jgi:GTP 3',8-cyclase
MKPDQYGRTVSYLRLSLTDRCNLRCFYCRGNEAFSFFPHDEILRYEELLQLIGLAHESGVEKVRLTGGEPMVRREFMAFIERALSSFPSLDLRLTTNATLLPGNAARLKSLGLSKVNISLDTLRRDVYEKITGADFYGQVRRAIDESLEHGLGVKINVVALKGVNEQDLSGFVDMAASLPLDVRFIEFMPIGAGTSWKQDYYWPAAEIVEQAGRMADLRPLDETSCERNHGPATMYSIQGGVGRIGVISPLSNHFCRSCNRLRITSDGRLRTCLFSDRQYRLRPLLRHPKLGVEFVRKVLERARQRKPLGYTLLQEAQEAAHKAAVCNTRMQGIGG